MWSWNYIQISWIPEFKIRKWWILSTCICETLSVYVWLCSKNITSFHPNRALSPISIHTHPFSHPPRHPLKILQCLLLSGAQLFKSSHTFTQTIYLHTPACPFTYFCRWIHMLLSPASPLQVGLHINHHLILHRQPGCLPNSPKDGGANWVSRRPCRSDGDRVRHHARRIHYDLLPGQRLHTLLRMIGCLFTATHIHTNSPVACRDQWSISDVSPDPPDQMS